MRPVQWGLLSTASIGGLVVEATKRSQAARFVAVASRDGDRARRFAADFGLDRAFGSYEALLDDDGVDAIYVAWPNSMHAEWVGTGSQLFIIAADHAARAALRAGDRPMALADRAEVLARLSLALSRPGADGVLATADIIEDLLLLGVGDPLHRGRRGPGQYLGLHLLKVPVVPDMERVPAASTLPALLLGGEVSQDQDAVFTQWHKALQIPSVCGLVADVAGAADAAVGLMRA